MSELIGAWPWFLVAFLAMLAVAFELGWVTR